jgi:hypothetical protein
MARDTTQQQKPGGREREQDKADKWGGQKHDEFQGQWRLKHVI